MKKIVVVGLFVLVTGCSEKQEYERAVLEQMKSDQDIKDYKISPETMTDCVVSTTAKRMPGIVPIDPMRKEAYKNYVGMLELNKAKEPKKTLDELRVAFGSPKGLADAHTNFSESVVECMSGLVTGTEKPTDQ